MKYTKGPWISRGASVRPSEGKGRTGGYTPLASAQHDKRTKDRREANARLIAAAPELLESLRWAVRQMPYPSMQGPYATGYLAAAVVLDRLKDLTAEGEED